MDNDKNPKSGNQYTIDEVVHSPELIKTYQKDLEKNDAILIVKAARGERESSQELLKRWRPNILQNLKLERENRSLTEIELEHHVQTICWETIQKHKNKQIADIGNLIKWAFYDIADRYKNEDDSKLIVNSILINGQSYFYVKDAARLAGVTPRALRNWIKNGEVKVEQHMSFSRRIIDVVPTPIFAELRSNHMVILLNLWLPRQGSNLRP